MVSPDEKKPASLSPQSFVDPLGRPMYQGNPRFTDQQAGGDLTGNEMDARDDNYVETTSGQVARDVSAHASALPAASADSQRYLAVAAQSDETSAPSPVVEPDGTEDPGANADDSLMPGVSDNKKPESGKLP